MGREFFPDKKVIFLGICVLSTIVLGLSLVACSKDEAGSNPTSRVATAQSIWNATPLGDQIAFFDKKYDLTPKEINDLNDSQQRVYELDEKSNCYLRLLVSKASGKIYEISADSQCNIKDDGHGVSPPYNSKAKFRDLTKDVNKLYPPLFEADCLNCGNAYEPQYYMTFIGPHANGFIDVIYSFTYNEGISNWVERVIKANGGYGDPRVDENKIDYSKYSSLAINLWSNESPNSITLRADGYK
jgi:hypothetical protein